MTPVTPVRFEPAALRSRVMHPNTEPLHSLFETCYRGINIEHKQIPKKKNILTDDENNHGTQYIKSFFGGYLLVLISNS